MSLRLALLRLALRLTMKPRLRRQADIGTSRRALEASASWAIRRPPGLVEYATRLGPLEALFLRPARGVATGRVLLFFHGGGYLAGTPGIYVGMLGRLAKLAGIEAFLPRYRLAPEHPFPAALEDARRAWQALMARGYAPGAVVLAGDSAGGGLALALLAELCAQGTPPAGLVAFSPWTDMTGSGASLRDNASADPMLPGERMPEIVAQVMGTQDPAQPGASPLFAAFPGAPPVLIQHGTTEILADDALRMADRLRAFGADVTVQSFPGAPHVWQFFDGWLPESRAALEDAGRAIRAMLSLQPR